MRGRMTSRARALMAQGVKRKEIARKLGRTVSAIYNVCKSVGGIHNDL